MSNSPSPRNPSRSHNHSAKPQCGEKVRFSPPRMAGASAGLRSAYEVRELRRAAYRLSRDPMMTEGTRNVIGLFLSPSDRCTSSSLRRSCRIARRGGRRTRPLTGLKGHARDVVGGGGVAGPTDDASQRERIWTCFRSLFFKTLASVATFYPSYLLSFSLSL